MNTRRFRVALPNWPDLWSWLRTARWFWVSLFVFGLTRLGIVLVAYFSMPPITDSTVPPPYHIRPDNILVDAFGSRWDTGFYLEIAEQGYTYKNVPLPSVAFFPLLPWMIRAVSMLTGDALIAGLLISNTATLGATLLLYRLVDAEWGQDVADRTVWYMLIFPTSFFGMAIYSEALFLLLAIGSLYFARQRFWESAGLLGFFAGLTRPVGIIIAPMLLVEWLQQRFRTSEQAPPWLALGAAIAPCLGLAAYMLYLSMLFGDPLAFMHAVSAWGRTPQVPLQFIVDILQTPDGGWWAAILTGRLFLDNWVDLLMAVLFMILGGILLYQRRWSEGVFVLLGILIPFSSGLLISQRRYVWVLFPAYILLARWGTNAWIDKIITTLFLLGLALFVVLFANWYWVA